MLSENDFNIMCSEVLEILKYCPKSDVNKIPNQLIDLLNSNKDITHEIKINPNKSIFEQTVIDETIIMIFIIFRNYWATQEEKVEIDRILMENEINFNNFYSYDKLFKQKDIFKKSLEAPQIDKNNQTFEHTNNTEKSDSKYLIEYNESIIKKIIKMIKDFFIKK